MYKSTQQTTFTPINRGYNSVFRPKKLNLGLVIPLETYPQSPVPNMEGQIERIQFAETLGFSAVWLRDVPFNVPSFGDAGQVHDPFVYLGLLAGMTKNIALGVASIVLPLRHPAQVAKAAASVDILSGGRLILGVASGDRPEEYPALNQSFTNRGKAFRSSFEYIRLMSEDKPEFENHFGSPGGGMDMLPKPTSGKLPLLITGGSQQTPEWLAQNGDGWMVYPRHQVLQEKMIRDWRANLEFYKRADQPVMEPLYIDFVNRPNAPLRTIHLGFQLGVNGLIQYLKERQHIGVNHVALNLRFNQAGIEETIEILAKEVLPMFSS